MSEWDEHILDDWRPEFGYDIVREFAKRVQVEVAIVHAKTIFACEAGGISMRVDLDAGTCWTKDDMLKLLRIQKDLLFYARTGYPVSVSGEVNLTEQTEWVCDDTETTDLDRARTILKDAYDDLPTYRDVSGVILFGRCE